MTDKSIEAKLYAERKQLEEKINNLGNLLDRESLNRFSLFEQKLMRMQLSTMKNYRAILCLRLDIREDDYKNVQPR